MKILYFGTYSKGEGYPRNRVILEGLREGGACVMECHSDVWREPGEKVKGIMKFPADVRAILRFLRAYLVLSFKYIFKVGDHDFIIVGYAGHLDVFLARLISVFRRKTVILDAFLSLFETVLEDRGLFGSDSFMARGLAWLDRRSALASDAVLLDTQTHIDYYVRAFGLPKEKFIRVFVGGEDGFFYPREVTKEGSQFDVLFFGTYLPLHGVDVIVRAAKLLKDEQDIRFTLIGDGQVFEECNSLAEGIIGMNLSFIRRWVNYSELADRISASNLCLGIFGSTDKALRVIPCKIFQCLAMARPIVTGDTPAVKELLVHEENAYLCERSNPEALASAILLLKSNPSLRERIASRGRETFEGMLTKRAIGRELLAELERRFT